MWPLRSANSRATRPRLTRGRSQPIVIIVAYRCSTSAWVVGGCRRSATSQMNRRQAGHQVRRPKWHSCMASWRRTSVARRSQQSLSGSEPAAHNANQDGEQVRAQGLRGIFMGVNLDSLKPPEVAFLQALLWEEAHLVNGSATRTARERALSLIRCLEPVNRLVPDFQGESLNRLREGPCPTAEWPWGELNGDEVLRLLWARLAESRVGEPS